MLKIEIIINLCICFLSICCNGQIIATYAGIGLAGYNGDNIAATTARIGYVDCITTDSIGNLYIADGNNERIREISVFTGIITTIAGNGTPGFSGDGHLATTAQLDIPTEADIAIGDFGNLYISDEFNYRIREVSKATGIITTIAGNGTQHHYGDGGAASAASFGATNQITTDMTGNLYINDSAGWIRKISTSGIITTIAGIGIYGNTGDGGPATSAEILCGAMACDSRGRLYFSDPQHEIIRRIDTNGIIATIAGNGGSIYTIGVPATSTSIEPGYLVFDRQDQLYFSESGTGENRILKIDTSGVIELVAGIGPNGFSGDGGPPTAAKLYTPRGVTFDNSGNFFLADQDNLRIREITVRSTTIASNLSNIFYNIYPNPTNEILNIDNIKPNTVYYLQSIVGSIVQQGTLQERDNAISIQSLPPGLYMLELIDDEGSKIVKKIVKQ